jgi:hypothetical protein
MISMTNLKRVFIETPLRGSENRCGFNGDFVIPINTMTSVAAVTVNEMYKVYYPKLEQWP